MDADYQFRACRSCGKRLLFVRDEDGKVHPLDTRAPVYLIEDDVDGNRVCRRIWNAYVTHFATCPHAGEHSKKGHRRG